MIFYHVSKRFRTSQIKNIQRKVQQTCFALSAIWSFTIFILISINGPKEKKNIYAILIFLTRFFAGFELNMSYLLSVEAFPTLATGLAFTITNVMCRTTTLFAPFIAESASNPSIFVTLMSSAAGVAQMLYQQ